MAKMMIFVRGNHGAGKSTVVRNILQGMHRKPQFGIFGSKRPEAYQCVIGKRPLYVLGPYDQPGTGGCDYLTKKGVDNTIAFLTRYREKGDLLFEAAMLSMRIMEPSVGKWLAQYKDECIAATLTTTLKECEEAIASRQKTSIKGAAGEGKLAKHLVAQQRMFERVSGQLAERGFRVEYVSRDDAPRKILGWLTEKR